CEVEGKKIEKMLAEKLTGLGIKEHHILNAIKSANLNKDRPSKWTDKMLHHFSNYLRKISKPMLLAFNKCDIAPESILDKIPKIEKRGYPVIPTSAEAELALRRAARSNIIKYNPGDSDFEIISKEKLTEKQLNALEYIKKNVLQKFGSTGIQKCIEKVAFELLNLIVVYPVEDEHHLTDKDGRVLPDAYLLPKGSTAKDLAYKVHTDLGEHFIRAVDARTHRILGADYELKDGDIIKIVANV
ncbi:MAG: TGS domain-containing protein, partial [Thermoplasmata archaeon]|nr:TGS domain-containing protein [Thermoplasmata archaeon]